VSFAKYRACQSLDIGTKNKNWGDEISKTRY